MSTRKAISLPRNLAEKKVFSQAVPTDYGFIKKLIWTYFFLLLFEGALRKWFLPGLSQFIFVVRDPIAIWIYYLCYTKGIFPSDNKYLQKCFLWIIIAVTLSFVVGKGHLLTIAYGARTNLLHFPLIFIMARVLTWHDVLNFGKAFLLLSFPMTWVVSQQFQADRFDVLNVAAGGTGHQLMTSGDKVRASGTFSFVSGIVFYYCFSVAFIIFGLLKKGTFPKWLLYTGISATLLAMVTAGSRAVIAESIQVIACIGFLAYYKPSEFGRIATSVFVFIAFSLVLYSQVDLFQEGLDFLTLRFEEAANVEGNPIEAYFNRYYEMIVSPYYYSFWAGTIGNGLGMHTRAGAAIQVIFGKVGGFGGAEIGWSRQILESGPVAGSLFILWRIWIVKDMLLTCLTAVKRESYLSIFLWGAGAPILLFTPLGQPTNLGFATFGCGLCLSAAFAKTK